MGDLTTGMIEEISTSRIKENLWKYGNLKSNISENDKEPSWDGFIYVYSKSGTEKKDDLVGRVPIQVKGTEVKKFSNKFNSFNIKTSDLKNYLHDGGVIFFVVEVKPNATTKIFYKELLPIDLKIYLKKAADNEWKSISIKIDKSLDKDIKFNKTCKAFLTHKKLQSSVAINNSISINDIKNIKDKRISIIGEENPFDTLYKDVYVYVKDEFNNPVPLNSKVTIEEVSCTVQSDLVIEGKKYFDNYKLIKNDKKHIIEFGDKISYDYIDKTVTIHQSKDNIITRFNTLDFFLKSFDSKEDEVKEKLKCFYEEMEIIERIIGVCNKFKLDLNFIKLSNMTENEEYFLPKLEKIDGLIDKLNPKQKKIKRELSLSRIRFFENTILVLKVHQGEEIFYVDYFSEDCNKITITLKYNEEKIEVSRFISIEKEGLLSANFDKDMIIKSIDNIKNPKKEITQDDYIVFALENIKAWNKSKNNDYLEVADYIFDWLEGIGIDDIIIINKALVEIRYNGVLSHKTREKLYKVKFNTQDIRLKLGISILLNDSESFNEYFKLLDNEDKEIFISYPIYNLYLDNLIK